MSELIKKLIIIIAVYVQERCLIGIFLERKQFDKNKMIKYMAVVIGLALICLIASIEFASAAFFIIAIFIFMTYQGTLLQKVTVFLFSLAIGCSMGLFDELFIDAIDALKSQTLINGEIFSEIRMTCEILILVFALHKSSWFNKNESYFKTLSVKQGLSISLVSVASIFVNSIALDIYENGINGLIKEAGVVSCAIYGSLFFTTAIIMALGDDITKQYYMWENRYIQEQLKRQLKYYQNLEKLSKSSRALKHDMKNHMIVIQDLIHNKDLEKAEEYVTSIQNTLKQIKASIVTGNSIVDAILNEKIDVSKEKHIDFVARVDLNQPLQIQPMDLCILFANSIDNAIEACEKIQDFNQREIKIESFCRGGYLIYNISNTTAGPVEITNNQVATNKKDIINHGFGINNIKNSIKKYDGECTISYNEGYFRLSVSIPING